jgi:hypothetical protein
MDASLRVGTALIGLLLILAFLQQLYVPQQPGRALMSGNDKHPNGLIGQLLAMAHENGHLQSAARRIWTACFSAAPKTAPRLQP